LKYYFQNDTGQHELQSRASGTTVFGIKASVLKKVPVELPSLPEQKAIAAVLSSLDDKIDLLHRQNQTLEAMAATLFRQWFVEDAQEDWEIGPLKKYVDIGIGRTPPRQEHQWFSENPEDVKWISIKDLGNDGAYIFNTAEYLTRDAVEQFNVPIIPVNTVVLSFKMTVGRVAITTEPMLSNEAIAHFKFRSGTPFSVEYLYLHLKNYQYDLLGSTSSIVTAINSAMIKDMEISIPDKDSMRRFDEVAREQFMKIRSNQLQIRTLETLRDNLLPKLMSGEVRVAY
jgi:type I restriction enzyme S subunit